MIGLLVFFTLIGLGIYAIWCDNRADKTKVWFNHVESAYRHGCKIDASREAYGDNPTHKMRSIAKKTKVSVFKNGRDEFFVVLQCRHVRREFYSFRTQLQAAKAAQDIRDLIQEWYNHATAGSYSVADYEIKA